MIHTSEIAFRDKRPIGLFLILVTIFAALGYGLAFTMGDENRAGGILVLQFSPLISALITRLIFQRNLRGFGWGWGKTRYQLIAYATPFLLATVSFSLVWGLGFGGFDVGPFVQEAQTGLSDSFGISVSSTALTFLVVMLLNGTLGLFVAFGSLGEELGWRGFLVPELYKHYSYTKTSIISAVIWAVFHYPLIIVLMAPRLEVSAWPLLIAILISAMGLTFILNWLRIKSGSVWTAVIFHAVLNTHTQGILQTLTIKTSWITHYVSGEHGFMLAIVSIGFGYLFWRKRGDLPLASK